MYKYCKFYNIRVYKFSILAFKIATHLSLNRYTAAFYLQFYYMLALFHCHRNLSSEGTEGIKT